MKFIATLGLVLGFSLFSFANEAKTERDVAQARVRSKVKVYEGTSTAYKMELQPQTYVISISGESAKAIWRTLKVKTVSMGDDGTADATVTWFQKVSTNITCDKFFDKEEKKSTFSCTLDVTNGVVGGGAAG